MLEGVHFVGTSTSRQGPASLRGVDPETGRELEPAYADATAAEIDCAMGLAASAQRSLEDVDRDARAAFLERVAGEIEALGDALLERAAAETGLGVARLAGERGRTVGQLRLFAELVREGSWLDLRIDHADPGRAPVPKPDVRRRQIALGPVVVFGAGNFPLAFSVAGGDTASALAAGCPVVVKGHPNHPGTSELVARAVVRAVVACGLPEGTFSLLHGRSVDVGLALVRHPLARAVGFTGSFRGGKALFDAAAGRPEPIPVFAEMGSVNPVFLLPRALAERADAIVAGLAGSITLGAGQFCTNPGVLVVPAGAAGDRLLTALGAALDASAAGTLLHAGIRAGYDQGLTRWQEAAGVEQWTTAGETAGACQARPALFEVDAATFVARPELREEVFGPASLAVRCRSKDEVLAVAEAVGGQLTATLHATAEDFVEYHRLIGVLEKKAGRLVVDAYPTGVEVCPAMHHGGPFPATTDARATSVGTAAIARFLRPVCYQGFPPQLLPPELRDENPAGLLRCVDGRWTRD